MLTTSHGVMRWSDGYTTRVAVAVNDGWEIMEVGEMVSLCVETEDDARTWCERGEITGEITAIASIATTR